MQQRVRKRAPSPRRCLLYPSWCALIPGRAAAVLVEDANVEKTPAATGQQPLTYLPAQRTVQLAASKPCSLADQGEKRTRKDPGHANSTQLHTVKLCSKKARWTVKTAAFCSLNASDAQRRAGPSQHLQCPLTRQQQRRVEASEHVEKLDLQPFLGGRGNCASWER